MCKHSMVVTTPTCRPHPCAWCKVVGILFNVQYHAQKRFLVAGVWSDIIKHAYIWGTLCEECIEADRSLERLVANSAPPPHKVIDDGEIEL